MYSIDFQKSIYVQLGLNEIESGIYLEMMLEHARVFIFSSMLGENQTSI